jgi:hypothetical protein
LLPFTALPFLLLFEFSSASSSNSSMLFLRLASRSRKDHPLKDSARETSFAWWFPPFLLFPLSIFCDSGGLQHYPPIWMIQTATQLQNCLKLCSHFPHNPSLTQMIKSGLVSLTTFLHPFLSSPLPEVQVHQSIDAKCQAVQNHSVWEMNKSVFFTERSQSGHKELYLLDWKISIWKCHLSKVSDPSPSSWMAKWIATNILSPYSLLTEFVSSQWHKCRWVCNNLLQISGKQLYKSHIAS